MRQGAVVLAADLTGRALRLATLWCLTEALGVEGYGRYAAVVGVFAIVGGLAPIGTDIAATLFIARAEQRPERVTGVLRAIAPWTLLGGMLTTLALASARWWPTVGDLPSADIARLGPIALGWALLLTSVGALRGLGAMRAQALSYQLVLPAAILVGAGGGALLGDVWSALAGWGAAVLLASAVALAQVMRRVAPALRIGAADGPTTGQLLRFALPQSLETTLYRATEWVDVLLLAALASTEEAGVFRIALAIVLIARLPSAAAATVLSPRIAAHAHAGRRDELRRELDVSTRWLAFTTAPPLVALVLWPTPLLQALSLPPEAGLLVGLLAVGQLIDAVFVPVARVVPMSGYAGLNMIIHGAVLCANTLLDVWWIPGMGALGAAAATSVALALGALAAGATARSIIGTTGIGPSTAGYLAAVVGLCGMLRLWPLSTAAPPVLLAALGCSATLFGAVWLTPPNDPVRRRLTAYLATPWK